MIGLSGRPVAGADHDSAGGLLTLPARLPSWAAIPAAVMLFVSLHYAPAFLVLGGTVGQVVTAAGTLASLFAPPVLLLLSAVALVRRRSSGRGRGGRPGQALVEMALITPLLLLLCLGCADLGRVFYTAISLSNAAREAAKAGSLSSGNAAVLRSGYCEQPYLTWNFAAPAVDGPCDPSNWGSWTSSYTPPPPSPLAKTAYISVAEDQGFPADIPSGSPNWSTTTPRLGGKLPVRVQIDYYWQPLTPLIGNLLPNGVLHIQVASEQREQY